MIAFNVVRFRVRPGMEEAFVARHRDAGRDMPGFRRGALVKTGDRTYCMIGEWSSMGHIIGARPTMIAMLDTFRDLLEDLGGGLGVTDPVSGEAVVEMGMPKPARPKAKAKAKAKPRAKKARKAPKKKKK
jgi:quinol monooxygenase YgiN